MSEALSDYVLDLAQATREHPRVALGFDARRARADSRGARARRRCATATSSRPDDVQAVARWVLAHRLVLKPEAALDGDTDLGVVGAILDATPRASLDTDMHFALRGYLFIALTALLGMAGTWSDEPAFAGAWLLPAFLLLAGLAIEAWYLRGTRLAFACSSTNA